MNTSLLPIPMLLICISHFAVAQDGAIDPTFNPGDVGFGLGDGPFGGVRTTAIQPDGKIIIGGTFTYYNGTPRNGIARLNADGSLDGSFNPGMEAGGWPSIAIQADGKMIIGAGSTLARLNADGSIDGSFNPGTGVDDNVQRIALQPDGKIIIVGQFSSYNGTPRNRIARVNADGSLDTSFDPGTGVDGLLMWTCTLQADGKIIIGGEFTSYNGTPRNNIARVNADGGLDASFDPGTGADYWVRASAILVDEKILIGGGFSTYNGTPRGRVARLNTDGSLDVSFDPGTGTDDHVTEIALRTDGKLIIAGSFSTYDGTSRNRIARVNTDGNLDIGFDPGSGAGDAVSSAVLQADSMVLIGGLFNTFDGSPRKYLARLNTDGSLDNTCFLPGMGADAAPYTTTLQTDGKIIIGGYLIAYNGTLRGHIARINADGSLDGSFDPGTGTNDVVLTTAVQADGKIIIGGYFTAHNGTACGHLARLNADGTMDATFDPGTGTNGAVRAIALQADGKILIGGGFTYYDGTLRRRIARLNADGSLDTSFDPGSGADDIVTTIAIQSDGAIIMGGWFTSYNGISRHQVARALADGGPDLSFDPGTGPSGPYLYTVALQADGKIIIGGHFYSYDGTPCNYLARLAADGSLDTSFNTVSGADGPVRMIALQPDGKLIIGGAFTLYDGTPRNCIARVNTDGSLDLSFDPGMGAGTYYSTGPTIFTIALQGDGNIIIGGEFTSYDGTGRNRLARIMNNPNSAVTSEDVTSMRVFPNPSTGIFTFDGDITGPTAFTVSDLVGNVVRSGVPDMTGRSFVLDLGDQPSGLYLLKIRDQHQMGQVKLVKQ